MRRAVGPLTWLLAVALATWFGLIAVNAVGSAARDRGPLGEAVSLAGSEGDDPPTGGAAMHLDDPIIKRTLAGEYGTFDVGCQGPYAIGEGAMAAGTGGWRLVRFEPGPDDDVEAIFTNDAEFVELEVFCDGGIPTIAELDRSVMTDD
jgi:hypothetical protein